MANLGTILYATFVEKEGAYIKIWGQTDRNISSGIEKALQQLTPRFQNGEFLPNYESLFYGVLCCAKYKDGNYYRARVTNTNFIQQGLVELIFIDFGNKEMVHCSNIRMMTSLPPTISNIPPQAKHYILANVTHPPPAWNDQNFEIIMNDVRFLEFHLLILTQIGPFPLIKLLRNNEDLALNLVSRGLAVTVLTQAQVMDLQNYLINMSQQHHRPAQVSNQVQNNTPTLLTYKTIPLEPGIEHEVFVSYVTDGPCIFSIQLKKMEDLLKKLMTEINSVTLVPLDENPLPGTVCLARSAEDGYICRAVITNMVDDQFKVFYVDFGNSEILPFEEIYQIPFKNVIPKVMATRFALADLEQSAVSLEMKCAFKKFVNDKLLYLTVKPTTTRSALSLCDLRDASGLNLLDVVKRAALISYPQPVILSRGSSHEIKVSYVYSCNRIYVQLMSKQEDLHKLMINLQTSCSTLDSFTVDKLKKGSPCYALFSDDNQWYRAEILNPDINNTKIRYVDFGNEEIISLFHLKVPDSNRLVMLRPQAIECCLNGYQNMEPDTKRDNILEELLLENEFNMKVIEVRTGRAIVDLFDKSGCNVALLLIEKLRSIQHHSSVISDGSGGNTIAKHSTPIPQKNRSPLSDNSNKWNKPDMENWRQKTTRNYENMNANANNSKPKYRDNYKTNKNHSRSSNESDTSKRYNGGGVSGSSGRGDNKGHYKKYDSDRSLSDNSEKNRTLSPRSDKFNSNRSRNSNKNNSYGGKKRTFDNSSNSSNSTGNSVDYAASNEAYPFIEMTGQIEKVSVTWFHNPLFFYCQLQRYKAEFCQLMDDIQNAYFKRKPSTATTGSPVVALFPEDGVLYRAIVLENNSPSYRVQYVDFGNIAMVDKIWPLERRFINLPAQAIHCALSGIKSVEDKWPQPDVYSSYFDKDIFDCNFVSRDLNKYFVELSTIESNVNKELIAANLAAALVEDTMDFSLLLGQQLRATVTSVFDLKQFAISFENIAAKCCAHNVEEATETYINVLKSLINTIVIIYVDDVQENVLIVTIYDDNGQKIVTLTPDEGAYDNVDMLCALPVFTTTINGYISHVMTDSICLQPTKYNEDMTTLLNKMYDHYNGSEPEEICAVESDIYAVLSSDENWYRGRAVKIDGEDIHIIYVDYGNSEIVKATQLKILTQEFLKQHMLAIKVLVMEDPTSYLDQNVTIKLLYGDNGWEGEILNANNSEPQMFDSPAIKFNELAPVNVPVQDDEEQLEAVIMENEIPSGEPISENQEIIETDSTKVETCSTEIETYLAEEQTEDQSYNTKGIAVILSHADSPSDFYLQLQEDECIVNNLQCALQEQIDLLDTMENPTAGVLCAALYSVDQQWYRAQILDYDTDIITVRFVDYGNTDVLDNNNTMIKTLPIELITLAQYARRCSLKIKPTDTEWSAAAFQKFNELTNPAYNLSVEIVDQDEKITYLNLYSNCIDVAEALIQDGHAVKLDINLEATCTGFICHLNSASEFYIQLESAVGDLEWVAEQLASAENFVEIQDLTPGALCAAIYPEDEMWYRARILSNTVAGLEVLFIDYGNSCTCTNMKELPEELVMLPPLAQKCSLDKPKGVLQWSPRSNEKFKELSAYGAAIYTINKIKPGETTVVHLLLNGEDISSHLMPILEKGRVLKIDALDNIFVIKAENEEKLRSVQEKLQNMTEKKLANDKNELIACEVNGKMFRAKVIGHKNGNDEFEITNEESTINNTSRHSYEVILVDDISTAIVDAIYQLPEDCEEIYASMYKLDSLPGVQFIDESLVKLLEINEKAAGLFDIEFISSNVLRLYLNGSDIRSQLGGIKLSPINSLQSTPKKKLKALAVEEEFCAVKDICKGEINNLIDVALTQSDTNSCDFLQKLDDYCDKKHVEDEVKTTEENSIEVLNNIDDVQCDEQPCKIVDKIDENYMSNVDETLKNLKIDSEQVKDVKEILKNLVDESIATNETNGLEDNLKNNTIKSEQNQMDESDVKELDDKNAQLKENL